MLYCILCIEGVLTSDAKRLLLANVSSSSPPHHRRGRCPMSAHTSEAAEVRGRGGTPHDIGTDPSAHSQQYILHCIVCIYSIAKYLLSTIYSKSYLSISTYLDKFQIQIFILVQIQQKSRKQERGPAMFKHYSNTRPSLRSDIDNVVS